MLNLRKSALFFIFLLISGLPAYSDCTLTGTPNNSSGNPLAGCSGIVTISGTLTINGNYNIGSQTITKIIITSTGRINWTSNSNLNLPAGCLLEIQPGGQLTTSTACNSQKTITRGNAPFASCNGNNVNYSFDQLMNGGGYSGTNAVTASSNSPVCQNTTLLLTCSPTGGVLPYSFSWTGPGGFTSNVQNPVVNNPVTGTYTVTVSDVLGVTATANTAATIIALPAAPVSIISATNICTGNSGPVSVIPDPNATSYIWWVAAPATLTNSGGPSGTLNIPVGLPTSGTYLSVRAVNACGVSDSIKKWVRSFISNPTLTGPTTICQGNTYTFVGRTIQGADSVRWTFPANTSAVMVNDTTYNVTFAPSYTTANIVINAYFVCQNTSLSRTIAPIALRTPGTISGLSTSLCDTTITFSINPVQDAIGYVWNVPAGATVIGPSNTTSITLSFNTFTTGTLTVQSINPCNLPGPVRSLALKGAPVTPASVSGPATVCAQQTNIAYSTPSVIGATSYIWTVPSGASIFSGQGTNAITVNWGSTNGNVNVKASRTCGGISSARSYGVTVNCRLGDASLSVNEGVIYPNPNKGKFIFSNTLSKSGNIYFSVLDLSGRTIQQARIYQQAGTTDHNLAFSLPEGMYLLKVNSADKVTLQKFIVE